MKNKMLNICLASILSLALHSVKAQSLQKKFESEMEQRKKHREALLLKVKEQQAQQQAEKRNEADIPQQATTSNPAQTSIQTNTQQKKNEVKPQVNINSKKPVTMQQTTINTPGK